MGIVELYRVQDGLIAVFDVFYKNPMAITQLLVGGRCWPRRLVHRGRDFIGENIAVIRSIRPRN